MKEYYREKLANLREIFRGFILLILALISAIGSSIFFILVNGFSIKIFVLMNFLFINFVILVFVLVKLYKLMNEITEKLKGD